MVTRNQKALIVILVLMFSAMFLVSCFGGAEYNFIRPSAEDMIAEAVVVYRGEMPCLVYLGTSGGGEDTFAFGTCDWSKWDGK